MAIGLHVGPLVFYRGRKSSPRYSAPDPVDHRQRAVEAAAKMIARQPGDDLPWPRGMSDRLFNQVGLAMEAGEMHRAGRLWVQAWVDTWGSSDRELQSARKTARKL